MTFKQIAGAGPVKSSLFYQLLLRANAWYFTAMVIAETLIYIYKLVHLPYPTRNIVTETILLIVMSIVEAIRNHFGVRGNLTESAGTMIVSVALSLPIAACAAYAIFFQTYVLRIEVILFGIQVIFLFLEALFGIGAVATFAR